MVLTNRITSIMFVRFLQAPVSELNTYINIPASEAEI
jgi:hypothetical protein